MIEFKERFYDQTKTGDNSELAAQALTTLMKDEHAVVAPVVFFNHPNRRPNSSSAPAYPPAMSLVDRWDPIGAERDRTWGQWLRKGMTVWGAIANSDFHNEGEDYWPCEFATTWVYAPDQSVDGIIAAMRAGPSLRSMDTSQPRSICVRGSKVSRPGRATAATSTVSHR